MKKEMKSMAMTVTIVLALNACSGGDTSASRVTDVGTPTISGFLIDSPVDGAKYTCGNITSFTGKNGSFFCEQTPVQFYVGDVKLGEIQQLPRDTYVTPQDLENVPRDVFNDDVLKVAVFLQSLDNDGDIEESIMLDKNLIKKLDNKHTELQQMTHTELIELLDTVGALNIVDRNTALIHLHQHTDGLSEHTIATDTPEEIPATDTTTVDTQEATTSEEAEISTQTTPALDDALKQAYLDIINEARSEGRTCGEYGYFPETDALTWDKRLYSAAYEHSKDMAISNTFSHTGSGTQSDETAKALQQGAGSSVGERIEHNNYTNWHGYGENIAAGTSMDEAVEAMEGWLKSPGHCKNIMKPEFKEVGMAVYYNANSHYKYYWTQDFGTR